MPSHMHVSAFLNATLTVPQSTLRMFPQSRFMQMEELTSQDTEFSSHQGKYIKSELTLRFYFPPTPGAHADPPYPLVDHSTTTGSSGIADVNNPSWEFSYNVVCPSSFTDLLRSPLDIYGDPTGLEGIHLPQPMCEGGSNLQVERSTILPTVPIEGEGRLEGLAATPADISCVPSPGICPVVPLCERITNEDEVSTQNTPAPATYPHRPSTGTRGPPQVLDNASWRSWNPRKPVISPHSSEKLDAAQRAARKVTAEQRQVKQQAISKAVAELLEEQETCINKIAKAHSILPEKVKLLITGETHYRNRREELLANALVHIKACQVNADHPSGQKFQLKELQEMVANDPDMQNLDEETKQKYLGELKESHSCKAIGIQSTNTAASHDIEATLKKVYGELQALAYHTGIYACLFVTRGHVYDTHAMTWFGTDNIMDFWEDWMDLSPDYIIKQLELWACNEEKNIEAHDSLENMQKQAKNGLDSGFSSITKHLHQEKAIRLRFTNFEQIKYKFRIDYEGWPDGIPFCSPYKIQTIDKIHRLQDAIRENSFQWVKMTSSQHHKYCKQVDARREASETVSVPHQGHSDKGKRHKILTSENTPQASKKACRGRVQTTLKS
ncbi:hypothetical protein EDD16DRAFT_1721404 [Pisolithus croceorrhizus]|nr:hypothetical protein EDD16DRAFT_1721404 [Pisolithus croceorrhizus]KAI6164328.1 hypothetical protein EDD17DRAFT_1755414 [Pisolithus thermaeus]